MEAEVIRVDRRYRIREKLGTGSYCMSLKLSGGTRLDGLISY
jgi:hypothetical protein